MKAWQWQQDSDPDYTAGAPQRSEIVELQAHRTFVRCAHPNVPGWVYGKRFPER
ncbi:hypothetical protein PCASD_17530 [Puccinia coronata f. sp. avenae]|uniref:Uncharacterized protein n=1 Tax=Puccinia coronata f. sp. avenae TaxID=200324 RepID=A0A2N5U3U7_9BASI|nr:hypothetical protein PCASD_17530 [Puccinia coronata f. sp. avenae]